MMIIPNTHTDINKIQAASGLNRREFGELLGYRYDSFKEFYSGRSEIQPHLRKSLIMYQLLTTKNKKELSGCG